MELESERQRQASRSAELAVLEDELRSRSMVLERREAEMTAESQRLSGDMAALQQRLSQADKLARLEVELAAREAEARMKVGGTSGMHRAVSAL